MIVEATKMVFEVFQGFRVGESTIEVRDNANGALLEKVEGR